MSYRIVSVFVVMESCLTKNTNYKWGLESNFNIETLILILILILTRIWNIASMLSISDYTGQKKKRKKKKTHFLFMKTYRKYLGMGKTQILNIYLNLPR